MSYRPPRCVQHGVNVNRITVGTEALFQAHPTE